MRQVNIAWVVLIWIMGCGSLFLFIKSFIVQLTTNLRLPRVIIYLLVSTLPILFEEYLTCEAPYGSCVSITLWAFYFLFLILYTLQTYFKLSWQKAIFLFGLIGWYNEFLLVGRIYDYPIKITAVLTPITILIYAVLAILPAYYLSQTEKLKNQL